MFRSKTELRVLELSPKLKPITKEQAEWGYQTCLQSYVTRYRYTLYCLDCGHSWKNRSVLVTTLCGAVCPKCKKNLIMEHPYHKGLVQWEYFGIIDTIEEMQVVRIVKVNKDMKKWRPAQLMADEVMQYFITPKGKMVFLQKSTATWGYYYNNWVHDSKLAIRADSARSRQRQNDEIFCYWPQMNLIPEVTRNGFTGQFYDLRPEEMFRLILSDSIAETLLKAGWYECLKWMKTHRDEFHRLWPSFKICLRRQYRPEKISIWMDYIDLLSYFGKDIRSPHYVCHPSYVEMHDRMVKKKKEILKKEKLQEELKRKHTMAQKYLEKMQRFKDLIIEKEQIVIKPLMTLEDVWYEGEIMKHCVYTNEYYKKDSSILLSAMVNGLPAETIEFSIPRLELIQSRGACNLPTIYHDSIVELVNESIPLIAKKIAS